MTYKDNFCDEQFWVFIKRDKKSTYKISMTGNINPQLDEDLVYCRLCPDTLMALGLCLVLRKLSRKSLEKVIGKYNSKLLTKQYSS